MNEIAPIRTNWIRTTAAGAGPSSDEAAKITGEATLVTPFSGEAASTRYVGDLDSSDHHYANRAVNVTAAVRHTRSR